jgi:hypothetical protein
MPLGEGPARESIKSFGVEFTGSAPERSTEEIYTGSDFSNKGLKGTFFRACGKVEGNRDGTDHLLSSLDSFNGRFCFLSSPTLPVEAGTKAGQYSNKILHQVRRLVSSRIPIWIGEILLCGLSSPCAFGSRTGTDPAHSLSSAALGHRWTDPAPTCRSSYRTRISCRRL